MRLGTDRAEKFVRDLEQNTGAIARIILTAGTAAVSQV
jgi:hypothetical protein